MSTDTSGARSLKTAATVLRALRLIGDRPDGLTAAERGAELGKSAATARYMVNTLCECGYARRDTTGRYRLTDAPPWGRWAPEPRTGTAADDTATRPGSGAADLPATDFPAADLCAGDPAPGAVLAEAVTELYRRTRQRSYLVRRTGSLVASVCDVRGHQGLAHLPGLDTHVVPSRAHGLALTRVLLAASPLYREAVESEPLEALTASTVTDLDALRRELAGIAARGWAVDDGEFAVGFATVAAPVTAPSGTSTVAIGLSCSSRRLAAEQEQLVEAVVAVARTACREWASAPPPDPDTEDLPVVSARRR